MNKKSRRRFIFLIILTAIFMYSFIGSKGVEVENEAIPIAAGVDLIRNEGEGGYYSTFVDVYEFGPGGNVLSRVQIAEGTSIGASREDRQRISNKKFSLGNERVYIIGQEHAQYGIRTILDILLDNPQFNDKCPVVVSSGKGRDLLNYKLEGYASPAEFIEGLISNSSNNNFFPKHISILDLYVRVDAEGRNAVIPYVELREETPKITGLAIFKGDKMIGKANMQEARVINLLKFDGRNGILTIQKDLRHYIDFYAKSKRKVKCCRTDGKYKFEINLELNGTVISNSLYSDIDKDPKALKKFTEDMQNYVKKICTEYADKIKNEYKTDIFELGRVAAAKYGRETGVDWNKVVTESNIEINVKVTVKDLGRGFY